MTLMSRTSGKPISDRDHLTQSIIDILTTPKGTRVGIRDYGCTLFYLLDRGLTPVVVAQMYGSISEAISLWEPRLKLASIAIDGSSLSQGVLIVDLEGLYLPDAKPVTLSGLELVYQGIG